MTQEEEKIFMMALLLLALVSLVASVTFFDLAYSIKTESDRDILFGFMFLAVVIVSAGYALYMTKADKER